MWRFVSFFHNIAGYPLIRPFHLVTTHRNPSYDLLAGATNPIDPNSEEWKQLKDETVKKVKKVKMDDIDVEMVQDEAGQEEQVT